MKTKKEEIRAEWERIQWIKRIIYGMGIPPATAVDYWADRERVQKKYNKTKNEQAK